MNREEVKYEKPPKVFISYSWTDNMYGCEWVADLAAKMSADGVDVDIDQYHESPPEGWTTWMINTIKASDFVLVVSTESYYKTINGGDIIDAGNGRRFEGKLIQQAIYNNSCTNSKFIPVIPTRDYRKYIIDILQDFTAYDISAEYDKLIRRLRGRLPDIPPLVKREVKTLFAVSVVDPILWTEAQWCSFGFELPEDDEIPYLKLTFRNPEKAVLLFQRLIDRIGRNNSNNELGLSFIELSNSIVLHIYPDYTNILNIVETKEHISVNNGISTSRCINSDDPKVFEYVSGFKAKYEVYQTCYLVPQTYIDGELRVGFPLKILCSNIKFISRDMTLSKDDPNYYIREEI